MLQFKTEYENFIEKNGVGSNDKVASSIKSYISYLNNVGRHLKITVSPKTLKNMGSPCKTVQVIISIGYILYLRQHIAKNQVLTR
ncbi:MAG: hypothetical protein JRE64_09500 [Deltaproteobacteria bacterium]|nr:hypothetical protein [Deltaproteobacteria bacterium]